MDAAFVKAKFQILIDAPDLGQVVTTAARSRADRARRPGTYQRRMRFERGDTLIGGTNAGFILGAIGGMGVALLMIGPLPLAPAGS